MVFVSAPALYERDTLVSIRDIFEYKLLGEDTAFFFSIHDKKDKIILLVKDAN